LTGLLAAPNRSDQDSHPDGNRQREQRALLGLTGNTVERVAAVVIALGLGWLFGRMHRPL